jgi:hypothetical protein
MMKIRPCHGEQTSGAQYFLSPYKVGPASKAQPGKEKAEEIVTYITNM